MAFPLPTPVIVSFALLVGLLSLVWLGGAIRSHRRFMRIARRATGVVESLKHESYGRSGNLYFPVVRFTTDQGVSVKSESDTGRNQSAYRVGQTVGVLYDPAKPSHVRIDTFSSRWIGVILPAFFGVISLCIAATALLVSH